MKRAIHLDLLGIKQLKAPPQSERVKSYRIQRVAFIVGRLCIKEVRPVAHLIRRSRSFAYGERKAHLWLKLVK
ncbi:hypothetical protein [Moorena sp. SIO3A2]|uniref:hypothetical protein n=1 Tax=Moorena sp. SIO3A2 TaxID=2607841 RepID=UPI0013B633E3|nr:hypothetical protein [Moorena sp. SIO3A2]NER88031.1 hypothetical protein [Moorena sp. SIO3A2]